MSVKARRKVAAKFKVGICVRQDCTEPEERGCRGNCRKCFNQFKYAKSLIKSSSGRKRFDQEQVELGNVLASSRGRCRKRPNPYLKDAV